MQSKVAGGGRTTVVAAIGDYRLMERADDKASRWLHVKLMCDGDDDDDDDDDG
jgi:hypothetical protein